MAGLERSATVLSAVRRWLTNRRCLNSQIMSPAVGMPAAAEAPAPSSHMRVFVRSEKRRAKSSAPISAGANGAIARSTAIFSPCQHYAVKHLGRQMYYDLTGVRLIACLQHRD